jgi:hypothetical protein
MREPYVPPALTELAPGSVAVAVFKLGEVVDGLRDLNVALSDVLAEVDAIRAALASAPDA